jgi:hypothetical protein
MICNDAIDVDTHLDMAGMVNGFCDLLAKLLAFSGHSDKNCGL